MTAETMIAKTAYYRAKRAEHRARRIEAAERGEVYVPPGITHGTVTGYRRYSCRCRQCTSAASARHRADRARAREAAAIRPG